MRRSRIRTDKDIHKENLLRKEKADNAWNRLYKKVMTDQKFDLEEISLAMTECNIADKIVFKISTKEDTAYTPHGTIYTA